MKKSFLIASIALLSLVSVLTSCSKDDNSVELTQNASSVNVKFNTNNAVSYKELQVEVLEINSGQKKNILVNDSSANLMLDKGSYKIAVNGIAILTTGEEMQVGGNAAIDVKEDTHSLNIDLIVKIFNEDFIIEEVFFTGVKTREGKPYTSGRYFKITNNTSKVLKTGGLLICQSESNTTVNHNITPDIKSEAFAVQAVMIIPEKYSKEVQPGDFIVVADMAMDHQRENIPAFDLRSADYEYPNLSNPKLGQVDNPAVPNTDVIYSAMAFNMFFLHDRGAESYAIARFPEGITEGTWLENYVYEYEYLNQVGKITKKKAYKIPNEWILDGVNSAATEAWLHNPLDASIDSGWTGCGTINSDPSRYGKSIRRRVISKMNNGKNLYKDTNNSTIDFIRDADPSLRKGIVH